MNLEFTVQTRIEKPIAEVFDAVYNPEKLVKYFATTNVKGAMDEGATVYWQFSHSENHRDPIAVNVKTMEKNKRIVLEWRANEHEVKVSGYKTTVEMLFEKLDDNATMVKITETGWHDNDAALAGSYQNCSGWSQMLYSLKGWIEHGFVLGMNGCKA